MLAEPVGQGGQGGRGGSALMHRAFREGRRLFVSRPRNHFPLDEGATRVLRLAGGIGVTPLMAMGHRLHALGTPFELHYSIGSRATAGFVDELGRVPWRERVRWHVKDEGGRADLAALLPPYAPGAALDGCGSPTYMDAVFAAALTQGWPEEALHREDFSVPEAPAWVNHAFRLRLARSGRVLEVAAERSATEVLAEAGVRGRRDRPDGTLTPDRREGVTQGTPKRRWPARGVLRRTLRA